MTPINHIEYDDSEIFYIPYNTTEYDSKKPRRVISSSEDQPYSSCKIFAKSRSDCNTPIITQSKKKMFRVSTEKNKKQIELSKYTNRKLIGQGSFWNVYKVKDDHDRTVVLKESSRFCIRENYQREYIINQLIVDETYLVKMDKVIEDEESKLYYGIMPLYYGTIETIICKRRMSIKEIIYTLWCVLHALHQLNTFGYVHLDVKPANMFIDFEGRVKLGDFGTARKIRSEVGLDEVGTGKYIAPEVYDRIITPENDVFSLAICLYEMVTGKSLERDRYTDMHDVEFVEELRCDSFKRLFMIMTEVPYIKRLTSEKLLEFSVFWCVNQIGINLNDMEEEDLNE